MRARADVDRHRDVELLESGDEGLVLREEPCLDVGLLLILRLVERAVLAGPVGDVERQALERSSQADRVMRPEIGLLGLAAPDTGGSASNSSSWSTPLNEAAALNMSGWRAA
jgi:hypothetical protein